MKNYIVKLEESVVYIANVQAHSIKEAELVVLQHPEKWQEQAGQIHIVNIEQGE